MAHARKPWHEPRVRVDGTEVGILGLPVPGPRGTAALFACFVLVTLVPGAVLLALDDHASGVGIGLLAAALVFAVLGAYAVRERRRATAG